MLQRLCSLCIVAICILGLVACVGSRTAAPPPTAAVDEPVRPDYLEHHVRYSGENLGVIAQWYTGRQANWSAIKSANPGLQPSRIHLGQVIRIPRGILVREDPLPQSFVQKSTTKRTVRPEGGESPSEPPSAPSDAKTVEEELPAVGEPPPAKAAPSGKASELTDPLPTTAPAEQSQPKIPPADSEPAAPDPAAESEADRERLLDELLK